jgi:hypothetical protein
MTLKTTKMFRACTIAAAASLLSVAAFAQSSISSSISGVIKDENGYALENATVTVVNQSTGAKYVLKTNSTGHYTATGLQPGGPYNVYASAVDHQSLSQRGFQVGVNQEKDVSFKLNTSEEEIVELEAFEIIDGGGVVDFGTGSAGPSLVLLPEEVEMAPSIDGGINDLARLNPFVVARTDVDYGDFQISAAGKNYRYNSIKIDGVQADDPFGLQANGLPSRGNLITKDAIQSMSVDIANYDVRYSGYTGALINAVTKSGTNEYKGSVYAYYRSDSYVGDEDKESDEEINDFKELTYGLTYGGPIIKDKLFFFIAYEKVKNETTPANAEVTLTQSQQDQIAAVAAQYGIADEIGTWSAPSTNEETDEKYLAKIDWNINSKHRVSFRYQSTEGETPVYYDYDGYSTTSYSSHWTTQKRTYETIVGQLFSDWTEDLSTEISVSKASYDSTYENNSDLPRIVIRGVGEDGSDSVELGVEESRQANQLNTDTLRIDAHASYRGLENHTISGGFQYETTDIYNMYCQYALGYYSYDSIEDWANDNSTEYRYKYALEGQTAAADYTTGTVGIYIQDKLTINPDLNITFGLRADTPTFEDAPAYNEQFYNDFGVANNNTPDMDFVIQPRVSISWKTMENKLRIRAGGGLFYGKVPAVWMGNSYGNTGTAVVDYRVRYGNSQPFSVTQTAPTDGSAAKTSINYMAEDFEMPSDWRYTLSAEYDLGFHGIQAVGEILYTQVNKAITYKNVNLQVGQVLADGREIYDGYKYSSYYDVLELGNTDEGESLNVSVGFRRDRNKEDGIAFSAFYIYGESKDVNGGTSSTASSNYYYTARLNSNDIDLATSAYEVRDRFLVTFSKQFKWAEGYETTLGLVYDAHSGRPFSWVSEGYYDVNEEGSYADNDLLYVPYGTDDPLYGGMYNGSSEAEFFDFIESHESLANAKGTVVARNSDRDPWVHRLDVSLTQNVKIWENIESKFFFSIYNFANLLDSDWGAVYESSWPYARVVANVKVVDGKYQYDFLGYDASIKTRESRWAMRFGMKLNF